MWLQEYDEMGEQNYSRNGTDILETRVLEGTRMTTDITKME